MTETVFFAGLNADIYGVNIRIQSKYMKKGAKYFP